MARDITYSVKGANGLLSSLKKARKGVAELKAANKATGNLIASSARGRTPYRTGALRGTLRAGGAKAGVVVRAGGARVPYAGAIHYGWPAKRIAAQPWIIDTAQATQAAWLPLYTMNLARVLDQVKGI